MESLYQYMHEQLAMTQSEFRRYADDSMNWGARMLGGGASGGGAEGAALGHRTTR